MVAMFSRHHVCNVCRWSLLVLVGMGIWPSHGLAQLKLEAGESVKVLFLNTWRDGTVFDKRGDKYAVQYEFAGTVKQDMFERSAIRMLCEVDAFDFSRTWASSSGQFKVDAALRGLQGDKVVLVKVDLTEVAVPISGLSSKDVAYIEKIRKQYEAAVASGQIAPKTPTLPDVQRFASEFSSAPLVGFNDSERSTLGTVPSFLRTFTQAGVGFQAARERQEILAVIPVGGPEQLLLVSTSEHWAGDKNFPNFLYWISLKQQKVVGTVYITPGNKVVDYDPRTRMMLSVDLREHGFSPTTFFTMWRLNPGESNPEPLLRWEAKVQRTNDVFTKIINERIVVAKTQKQTLVAWDLVENKEIYAVNLRSFFEAPVRLSWDRRHLIVPYDGGVSVLHAATGDVAFQLPLNGEKVSGANVNESGTKLAAVTSRSLYLWDLEDPNLKPVSYTAPLIGNPFRARVEWVDDDNVFLEGFRGLVLFRLSLELPIWSYETQREFVSIENRGFSSSFMLNGFYFYTASPDPFGRTLAVGAVKLPGPSVQEMTGTINKEQLLVIRPGVRVRIGKLNVTEPEFVRAAIEERIAENGWSLDDKAEIVIDCEMGRGSSMSETYSAFDGSGSTTVSFTPHTSSIKIQRGRVVLWQASVSTGAPGVVSGDDIQRQVSAMQEPQLDFFRTVKMPSQVLDPKYGNGFGKSKFGLRGIEVVSTSPPGRDDDPDLFERNRIEEMNRSNSNRATNPGLLGDPSNPFGN